MTTQQIILYVVIGLVILFYVKRWMQRARMIEYSAAEVSRRLNDPSMLLLDVRTKEERSRKHIKGSIHIPINELSLKINLLEPHKAKEIICYCHSGSRSSLAAFMLSKQGFQVANMRGGMIEWNGLDL